MANPFSVGAAILWLPFFLGAHAALLLLRSAGSSIPCNGVGYVYEAAVCLGTILYASIGVWFTYRVALRLSNPAAALVAALGICWASQGIYYVIAEPSMAHGLTIFTTGLFLFVWYPPRADRSLARWFGVGLAAALAALVRPQEGILVALGALQIVCLTVHRQVSLQRAFAVLAALGGALLLGLVPQLWMWADIYGSLALIPQGSDFMRWSDPRPLQTLFSTRHGLITWHPVHLLALIGLIPLWRLDRRLAAAVTLVFLGQLYVNSAVTHWWADDAFGGRRFTGLLPLLGAPLAVLIADLRSRDYARPLLAVLLFLVVWNGLSFAQYRLGLVSKSEALTFREMTIDRVTLPWSVLKLLAGQAGLTLQVKSGGSIGAPDSDRQVVQKLPLALPLHRSVEALSW